MQSQEKEVFKQLQDKRMKRMTTCDEKKELKIFVKTLIELQNKLIPPTPTICVELPPTAKLL